MAETLNFEEFKKAVECGRVDFVGVVLTGEIDFSKIDFSELRLGGLIIEGNLLSCLPPGVSAKLNQHPPSQEE